MSLALYVTDTAPRLTRNEGLTPKRSVARNDGRALIDPFYKLPSRKELPDYYEVIRKPMDVRRIVHKIDESKVRYRDIVPSRWHGKLIDRFRQKH